MRSGSNPSVRTVGRVKFLVVLTLLAFLATACGSADDDASKRETEAAADYSGATIRILVGFSAGGGFDTYARTIARHLSAHLPGEPNVVVENMPGAGGLLVANRLYSEPKDDGTVFGYVLGSLFLQGALGRSEITFEGTKFQFLGAPAAQKVVCVVNKAAGISSLEGLAQRGKPLVMGGTAPGDATVDVPRLLKEVVGLDVEAVRGYDGTAEIVLAMAQGEVDGGCWGWESMITSNPKEIESGEFVPLVQSGPERQPELPDVPLFDELVEGSDEKQLIEAGITVPAQAVRTFVAPPGTPDHLVEALRAGLTSTFEDKAFQAEAAQQKLGIDPIGGEELAELVTRMYELPPGTLQRLDEVIGASD